MRLPFRYPGTLFSRAIERTLRRLDPETIEQCTIFDAPCGDGYVSAGLSEFYRKKLSLYDRDPRLTARAKDQFGHERTQTIDVHQVSMPPGNNVWLLVNSLYCLEEGQQLVRRWSHSMKYIVAIFPHLDTANYRAYMRQWPHTNPSALDKRGTQEIFERVGYSLIHLEHLAALPQHLLNPSKTQRLFQFGSALDTLIPSPLKNYWLATFVRSIV